jgi:transmembrane sensor
MIDVSPEDKDVLAQFRKGAIEILPDNEKKALWRRIEKSVGNPFGKWVLPGFYRWVAVACVALLAGIGYWWYNNYDNITMLVVETQFQQRRQVTLPDATVVWLNAGSRLEYPEAFTGHRFVFLAGEAWFDVARDTLHPFTVHASGLDVSVLGTVFNMTAYGDDTDVITTLVEGEIALRLNSNQPQQTILKPNQQAIFNKDSQKLTFATVDPELYTSWVKGYYRFENVSFEQIARYFERVYGVKTVFEDNSMKALSYSGAFLHEQSLETVLEFLREIKDFHYTIDGNQLKISQ